MSFLRYLCLFAYIVVSNTYCVVFFVCFVCLRLTACTDSCKSNNPTITTMTVLSTLVRAFLQDIHKDDIVFLDSQLNIQNKESMCTF
jgi:hypothetical protein